MAAVNADVLCPDLTRAFDACGDPVFVVRDDWTILYWNAEAEAAFGQRAADVVGRNCYEIIAGMDDDGRALCRARCERWGLARRGVRVRNYDMRCLPAHDTWLNFSILPINDPAGRPVALAHIVRNIERFKRLEHFVRDVASSAEQVLSRKAGNGNGGANGNGEQQPLYLTGRELEVLGLLARGAGTKAMADSLGVSTYTIHNHIAAVLNKLGVHSRAEAVAFAFKHHLV